MVILNMKRKAAHRQSTGESGRYSIKCYLQDTTTELLATELAQTPSVSSFQIHTRAHHVALHARVTTELGA